MLPMFIIYSAICDILELDGRIMEAVGFFRHMQRELAPDTCIASEEGQWGLSESQRMDTAGGRLSTEHRFSATMHKEIRGACWDCNGFSELQ